MILIQLLLQYLEQGWDLQNTMKVLLSNNIHEKSHIKNGSFSFLRKSFHDYEKFVIQ